jgi:hypothetical protein
VRGICSWIEASLGDFTALVVAGASDQVFTCYLMMTREEKVEEKVVGWFAAMVNRDKLLVWYKI